MTVKTKLGILGADGRMGAAVDHLARGSYEIVARVSEERPDYSYLSLCDVVIDFSAPAALLKALPVLKPGAALVSGTTGLTDRQEASITTASSRLAILRSGNFSLGIHVLLGLAERAAAQLDGDWDIEVLEMHHKGKVDAPSGTALMVGEALAKGRGVKLSAATVLDRTGLRKAGDIGFAVLRGGGVYGNHEVRLASESEMITLGHQALNRDVFARGALKAASWLSGQMPGLYTMDDVLGL